MNEPDQSAKVKPAALSNLRTAGQASWHLSQYSISPSMHAKYRTQPTIILQPTGQEALLFDLERDAYFAINHTASLIWSYIEAREGVTAAEIVNHLVLKFKVDQGLVARDVSTLLTHWCDGGMLTVHSDQDCHD